jgi:hypothetical protein
MARRISRRDRFCTIPQRPFSNRWRFLTKTKEHDGPLPERDNASRMNGRSVLEGSGGNVAVLAGPDGKVLDAGITASRPRILESLASLSGDPIRHLINTHGHFDHADGNEWLQAEGATILGKPERFELASWRFRRPTTLSSSKVERKSPNFLVLGGTKIDAKPSQPRQSARSHFRRAEYIRKRRAASLVLKPIAPPKRRNTVLVLLATVSHRLERGLRPVTEHAEPPAR